MLPSELPLHTYTTIEPLGHLDKIPCNNAVLPDARQLFPKYVKLLKASLPGELRLALDTPSSRLTCFAIIKLMHWGCQGLGYSRVSERHACTRTVLV